MPAFDTPNGFRMTTTNSSLSTRPLTIISGGQTGVDRAALDMAMALKLPHTGWCPRGRLAEDGPIDPVYNLQETSTSTYSQRTHRNVTDSDGTMIIYLSVLSGGSLLTSQSAKKAGRPLLLVDLESANDKNFQTVLSWLDDERIHFLNVAGPRESTHPGIYNRASIFLRRLLSPSA